MLIQMLLKEKRIAQLYTLILFLVLALIFLAITFYMQVNEDTIRRNEIEVGEFNQVQVEKNGHCKQNQQACVRRTDYRGQPGFRRCGARWHLQNRSAVDCVFPTGPAYTIKFVTSTATGTKESVSIAARTGRIPLRRPTCNNKADRYYFSKALPLQENEVYVSQLDLNIENGQIERPIKTHVPAGDAVL